MLLKNNPFRRGKIIQLLIIKPKKPNSAQRKVVKVLVKDKKKGNQILFAYLPGMGNNLSIHNIVLIKGGKVQDLPSIDYKIVRGVYDCSGVTNRITSRSKYGTKAK